MKKTLIVVDMQNDFVYGPLGTPEARAIVPNVQKKIEEYRESGHNIIFTMDTHYEDYLNTHEGKRLPVKHCRFNTGGWCIVDPFHRYFTAPDILLKTTFGYDWSSFCDRKSFGTSVNEIELVGVCTDICVVSNALILRAVFPDIDITVDASCCAGTTPEKHKAALEVMKSCHIDVINE